jgi:hypothetical protein
VNQDRGGVGEEDLAAPGRSGDAGGSVYVDAKVVVTSEDPVSGVKAHANAHGPWVGPSVGGQGTLDGYRGPHGASRRMKHGEESVPLGADHGTAGVGNRAVEDLSVCILHGPVVIPERLQESGRPLDVREKKGQGPGGEFRHR